MIPDGPADTIPATRAALSGYTTAVRVLGRDPVALYLDQLAGSSPETARRSLRRLAKLLGYDDPDRVPWGGPPAGRRRRAPQPPPDLHYDEG